MKRRKSRKLILLLILFMGIGFATISYTLNINGLANFIYSKYDVHVENVQVQAGSVTAATPTINAAGDTITFSANLQKEGDYYSFIFDVVNAGTIDAAIKLSSITTTISGETIDVSDFSEYSIEYVDGGTISTLYKLPVNNTFKYKVMLKYKANSDFGDYEDGEYENISIVYKITLNAVRYTNAGSIKPSYVCMRATTLHTEECTKTSDGCYADGYYAEGSKGTSTITYGNLGTKGQAPVDGDAYDCDVDNSGTFDDDERFYYISDYGSNEGYATLIYYNNVGISAYHSSGYNYEGPVALLNTLPLTSEWSNTGLNTGMTRQIKNELDTNTSQNGSRTLPNFTYTGRAARQLTAQEVNSACGITIGNSTIGELGTCQYLLENTTYAASNRAATWWLETPAASYYRSVWYVGGGNRYVGSYIADNTYGVRPAIEVLSTKIEN